MAVPSRMRRTTSVAVVAVLAGVAAGVLLTGCGKAQASAGSAQTSTAQQCAQAVLGVLSTMVSRPYDSNTVQDFLRRYDAGSAAYTAYRDSFTTFFSQADEHGVQAAENAVRVLVQRDCSAA